MIRYKHGEAPKPHGLKRVSGSASWPNHSNVAAHPLLPKVLPGMESELLRPFRAFLLRGFGSQGVALGYNITPFQGLMLV